MNDLYHKARYVRGRGWVPLDILSDTIGLEHDAENLACCEILDSTASYSFFVDNLCGPGRSRYLARIATSPLPFPPRAISQLRTKRAWLRSATPIPVEFAEAVVKLMPVAGLDNIVHCMRFYGLTCAGGPRDPAIDVACDRLWGPDYWTTFQFDGVDLLPLIPVCEHHLRAWQVEYADCPVYFYYKIQSAYNPSGLSSALDFLLSDADIRVIDQRIRAVWDGPVRVDIGVPPEHRATARVERVTVQIGELYMIFRCKNEEWWGQVKDLWGNKANSKMRALVPARSADEFVRMWQDRFDELLREAYNNFLFSFDNPSLPYTVYDVYATFEYAIHMWLPLETLSHAGVKRVCRLLGIREY